MIYVTGDTHGDFYDQRLSIVQKNLTEKDYLIVCGDFGYDWNDEYIENYHLTTFLWKHTTLFCCGNHENYDILNSLPEKEMFGDVVKVFDDKTYFLQTGHMYTIDGKRFFVFGGAASIDKDWRVEWEKKNDSPRTLWWSDEVPSEEQFALAKKTLADNDYTFDYFITHTCKPELKAAVLMSYKADFYDPTEVMIRELEELIKENNGSYKIHFFGHFHTNISYDKEHCLYESIEEIRE